MRQIRRGFRLWLGSLFLYAASLKLARYEQAGEAIRRYGLLPNPIADASGFLLPVVELTAGMSLLSGRRPRLGALLGASLGASFAGSSYAVLHRGTIVPCGCAGAQGGTVTQSTFRRGVAIALASLALLTAPAPGEWPLPRPFTAAIAGAAVAPGLAAFVGKRRFARLRRQEVKRRKDEAVRLTRLLATPLPKPPGPEVGTSGHRFLAS